MSVQADEGLTRRPAGGARTDRLARATRALSPGGWLLAVTAAVGCALAFAALARSSWADDELFTLFVVDHRGGLAEVLRRALTDTHPPTYYLLLYGWMRAFGAGETALRLLSALLAVGAVAVFVRVTRGLFTREARAFAAAIAVTSPIWFWQSQTIRNYSLCFLLTAVMLALALALRRRVRAGGRFPAALLAGLAVTGLLDATSHFYGLLGAGALMLALMVSLPSWPVRTALAASGLLMVAVDAAWARALAAHTQENWNHLWFSKDPGHLLAVVNAAWEEGVGWGARWVELALLAAWALGSALRRPRAATPANGAGVADEGVGEGAWLTGVCAFVLAGVYLAGFAETLLSAPTLSDRNVLTAAPAAWVLTAALYDAALRRWRGPARLWLGVAVGAVMLVHGAVVAQGRWLERNNEWRASAAYVAHAPGCADAVVPVIQSSTFGPDTPFYRRLAQEDFFGRYIGPSWRRLQPHLLAAFVGPDPDRALATALVARAHDPAACSVLVWAVHDVTATQAAGFMRRIDGLPGMKPGDARLRTFPDVHFKQEIWLSRPSAFVIERAPATGGPAPAPG